VKQFEGETIEKVMLDMLEEQPGGNATKPCTSVECLLNAAAQAARIFILKSSDLQLQKSATMHDTRYDNYN
jgi:hypothetical protein